MSAPGRGLLRRFVSQAGIYGMSLMITRLGWLILLPILWAWLSPLDFGIIGIAQMVQAMLLPVLGLGLPDSIMRFYREWSAEERPRHIAALMLLTGGWSLAVVAAMLVGGSSLFAALFVQVPFSPYLEFALATAFFSNLGMVRLSILRIREEVVAYSYATIGMFATQAALTLLFVIGYDAGAAGYLLGVMLGAAAWALYFVWTLRADAGPGFRWSHAADALRYGLPMVPAAILDGVASLLDRWFLDKHVGLAQIGLYNLGNQFGAAFNAFNQLLKASWVPFLYRVVAEDRQAPSVLARFSVYYLALLAVPALAVALLSKELIEWFGDARYHGIYPLVPWFVLVYYLNAVGTAMGRGLDLARKTGYWLIVAAVGVAASLAALWLLVPAHGVAGAIAAVLVVACVRNAVQLWLAHRFYPRPVHGVALARLAALTAVTFGAGYLVDFGDTLSNAMAKTAVVAVGAGAILWFTLGAQACRAAIALVAAGVRRHAPGG
jgi:O-antigen/teichoic acid export membrane protein